MSLRPAGLITLTLLYRSGQFGRTLRFLRRRAVFTTVMNARDRTPVCHGLGPPALGNGRLSPHGIQAWSPADQWSREE